MSLTDTRRAWVELRDAGTEGVHSWDIKWSKNFPQRMKDVVSKGQAVYVRRENRNGRAGARYWLEQFAPPDATPVKPNGLEGGDGLSSSGSVQQASVAPLSFGRPCRRCNGDGTLPYRSMRCPACFGEGRISHRRVNSFVEQQTTQSDEGRLAA